MSWLGSTLMQMGRYSAAQTVFRQALQQAQSLRAKHPADQGRLEEIGNAAYALADALWRDGQAQAAVGHFNLAVEVFQALSRLDPQNRAWAFGLIRAEVGALRDKPSKLKTAENLQRRLAALEAGRKPSARWHPLRAELAQVQAFALWQDRRDMVSAQTLVNSTLSQLRKDSAVHTGDLKLNSALLELSLFQAEILSTEPTERLDRCKALLAELNTSTFVSLQRVHAELTRLAARAQTCLGRAEEALALQQWLDAQRSWTSDHPQPAPSAARTTS